jgi:hypothetical protein
VRFNVPGIGDVGADGNDGGRGKEKRCEVENWAWVSPYAGGRADADEVEVDSAD